MIRRVVATGLVAGVFVLTGCGDDDDDSSETSAVTTADPAKSTGPPAETTVAADTTAAPDTTDAENVTTTAAAPEGLVGLNADFGTDGVQATPLSPTDHDRFINVAEGPDGKIYTSGFTSAADDHAMAVTRFEADGTLDTTWGTGGIASVNVSVGTDIEVGRGLVVLPDGSAVVAGPAEHDAAAAAPANEDADLAVVKFDATGAPDPAFGTDGVARIDLGAGKVVDPETYIVDTAWGLGALADGKLAVFGATPNQAADRTDTDFALIGLNADGSLDQAFGNAGTVIVDVNSTVDNPRNVTVQPDGQIVATGYSRDGDGIVSPVLIRASAQGVLDAAFGIGGVANEIVLPGVAESYKVDLQGDNYILAGYGRGADSEEKVDLISMRFTADGTWDQTYGTEGGVTRLDLAGEDDRARNLVVLPDGQIVVSGSGKLTADDVDAMVVLLSEDGIPVETFGTGGYVLTDLGGTSDGWYGVTLSADEKTITLAGFKGADPEGTDNDDGALAQLTLP